VAAGASVDVRTDRRATKEDEMTKRALQRMGIVVLLLAGLAAAPAGAAERPGTALARGEAVLTAARLWLGHVLAGWGIAPAGPARQMTAVSGEEGQIFDPNGLQGTGAPTSSPQSGETGPAPAGPGQ
jgi:hypothetical protein